MEEWTTANIIYAATLSILAIAWIIFCLVWGFVKAARKGSKMEWTESKMLTNIEEVLSIITTQMATEGRAYSVPKRQLEMMMNEMEYLGISIRSGLVRDKKTNKPELFSLDRMKRKEKAILFSSLGALIGIYKGLPSGKDILKILRKFFAYLVEKL